MGYQKIDLYTQYFDWERSYHITSIFLQALEGDQVRGYSYNFYHGPAQMLSYVTVRFDFINDEEGKQEVENLIADLQNRGLIVGKSVWSDFTVLSSVEKGAEIATRCAFAFFHWMDANSEAKNYFLSNPNNRITFMSRFLALFLRHLGFTTYLEQYPATNIIPWIDGCASRCADAVGEDFQATDLNIDFMERLIHHFLNCVHINLNEESIIYDQIRKWIWLGKLLESRS